MTVFILSAPACAEVAAVDDKVLAPPPETPGYYDLDRPGRPPSRPEASAPDADPEIVTFAMRRFYFGISKRGTAERDPEAWRRIGWDLDGLETRAGDAGSATSCTTMPVPAALPDWIDDGDDGRDNAMGASFFQLIGDFDKDGEHLTNAGLEKGASTLVLELHDVNDLQTDDHVPAALYVTTHDLFSGPVPAWDGSDVRKISSVSFWPDSKTPMAQFADGYIRDGVWVSGDQHEADLTLQVPFYPKGQETDPVILRIRGRSGWLTATIGDGSGGPGTFGFNCRFQEFRDTFFEHLRKAFNCTAQSSIDDLLAKYAGALDTHAAYTWDPAPADACDAMSWGLDLEWARIAAADTANPVPQVEGTPCPP